MSRLQLDRELLKQHRALFRELDKDVQKVARAEIKGEVTKVADAMEGWVGRRNPLPPMSGMAYGTKWKWNAPRIKASLRLSAGPGKPIATLYTKADGKGKMFAITELAGSKSDGFSKRGEHMIDILQDRFPLVKGNGGRFMFRSFLIFRPDLHDAVFKALQILARRVNSRKAVGRL